MRPLIESMRAATVFALVIGLAACGDDGGAGPVEPTPGVLTVSLETPNAAEAAVLFRIVGPEIEAVSPYDASALLESNGTGTTVTIALFGTFPSGPIARVTVADTRASYTVQLQQVAGGDNALHTNLDAYDLSIQ